MSAATVVVPTYNRAHLLPRVLEALLHQDYPGAYDVVVVDDGSRDETPQVLAAWVERHPGRLRIVRQVNAGPARARNQGVALSTAPFVAFIDDDCVAEPSWLHRLQEAMEQAGAQAVAGAVTNPADDWLGRYINCEHVIDHVVDAGGTVTELITGNAGVRVEVFRQLGGFDEAIRVAGGEDTELSVRLRAQGHRIAAAPDARVFHESRSDLGDYLRMVHRHGRGRRRLGERFPAYRWGWPGLRLVWLAWPLRTWMVRDWARYRRQGVPGPEGLAYVGLRYLENLARMAGYMRGTH